MPPIKRTPIPRAEKKKKAKPEPQTSDEWQDHGVFLEESGEKWRSGDVEKALRFFHRAAEAYKTALALEPTNFDAAYNFARVLFVIATDDRVGEPGADGENLERAVAAHRVAIALRPGNLDALFNFSQALAAWGEYWAERRRVPVEKRIETVRVLEEASKIFEQVWVLYEERLRVDGAGFKQAEEEMDGEDDEEMEVDDGEPEREEQWAVVESPVNEESLLDASLAHIEVLTQLAVLATENHGQPLSVIQSAGESLIARNNALFAKGVLQERIPDAMLTRANFISALSDSLFKTGALDYETYANAVECAYSSTPPIIPEIPTSAVDATSISTLADTAAAFVRLATTITPTLPQAAWTHLTFALSQLTTAAKAFPREAARIHLGRGDIEVMRARLPIPAAEKNRDTLWKNAGVYYRASMAVGGEVKREAATKERMVRVELGEGLEIGGPWERELVVEAVDEGVFGNEWFERVGIKEI